MKLKLFVILTFLTLFSLTSHANFFKDLFTPPQDNVKIVEQDAEFVEEEVISAEDYMDSVDEPTDIGVFSQSQAFDENEEFISDGEEDSQSVRAQTIFLSFVDKPDKIYLSQHAIIKIKVIVTDEGEAELKTTFLNSKNSKVLNKTSPWKKISNSSYENNYIVKLFSTDGKIPDFKITAVSENGASHSETLPAFKPKIIALREDKEFSLVLSQDFTLHSHNEKKYDEKSNIIVLEINATTANLEDFHIPYAIREGIDDIKQNGLAQSVYYFAIIPNDIKVFKFKYFDLLSNKYNIVSFPIILQDTTVSTQTNLNPQKSKLALYKALALIMLAFIIFLFYLKYKKPIILISAFIILVFVVYLQIPMSKITLEKDIKLRILPTKNSTIFYITDKTMQADMLLKKDGYIKVLLPNKKIGWIDEDFTEN